VDKLTISHYASLTNSGKMSQTTFYDFKGIFPGKSTVCLPDTMIVASTAAFNNLNLQLLQYQQVSFSDMN
jgi:hypothetical protein